ncbi:hypothetical protein GGTG_08968 [Gaeumannomyces tritici R3-111a-1]|uniref:MARVEL domain-containing protein n=1 Tax=Gaeumannomyces tritici (strain R3-111a-1) TaxID=644352 RepID=J3P628_GAET3|nr:hypothetical protein GGTG_08968 [Gaeumannomyces tritici R3-111a-1]EJT75130.1 hypothetical protein GGTG_08968 [Gaeumannomyces tritici R3-111a-1]
MSPEIPAQTPPAESAGASGARAPSPPPAASETGATAGVQPSPRRPSLWERLRASDKQWPWKAAVRLLQCVAAAVGIACSGYVLANLANFDRLTVPRRNGENELFVAFFALSFIWGAADLLVRFLRRYSRPLHPLLVLIVDFCFCCVILYLAAIVVSSVLTVREFANDPNGLRFWRTGSAEGPYKQDSSGVWVYTGGSRRCTPAFADCAAQDAAVNAAWGQQPLRFALAIVIAVMVLVAGLCHFVLGVWAAVDFYARRKRKTRALMSGYQPVYVPAQMPVQMQPMQPVQGPYDKQIPGHQAPMPQYGYGEYGQPAQQVQQAQQRQHWQHGQAAMGSRYA